MRNLYRFSVIAAAALLTNGLSLLGIGEQSAGALPAHSNARTASIANPKLSARSSTPVGRLRRAVQAERGGVPASPASRPRNETCDGMRRLWPLRYDRTFKAPDDGQAQG